jgi:hypothetical protein
MEEEPITTQNDEAELLEQAELLMQEEKKRGTSISK